MGFANIRFLCLINRHTTAFTLIKLFLSIKASGGVFTSTNTSGLADVLQSNLPFFFFLFPFPFVLHLPLFWRDIRPGCKRCLVLGQNYKEN